MSKNLTPEQRKKRTEMLVKIAGLLGISLVLGSATQAAHLVWRLSGVGMVASFCRRHGSRCPLVLDRCQRETVSEHWMECRCFV